MGDLQGRKAHRFIARAAALLAALALAACGGGDYVAPATPQAVKLSGPLGDPVTQTVGAAGGTLDATTLGVKVHFAFPAGALSADTLVKVTPVAPVAGDFVSLKLEPGSLVFARPVTVTMELPAGITPDALASLRQDIGGAGAYAPTVVDKSARTLTATLVTFGGANLKPLGAAAADRKHAQRAGPQDDPLPDPPGSLSAQQRLEITLQVTAARASIADLQARGLFIAAIYSQQQIAGLLMRSGEDGYIALAQPFLSEAHDTACRERAAAITRSQTASIAAWGDYKPVVSVIMYWDSLAMRLGGTPCTGSATDAASNVVKREFDLVNAGLGRSSTPAQIAQPASDVRGARELKREARTLQSTDPAASAAQAASGRARATAAGVRPAALDLSGYESTLQTQLLDPAVMPARQSAWTAAKTGATLVQYADLLDAFGPTAVLQQDVQFVRTRIDVQSSDSTGAAVAAATLGFAALPDAPADPVRSATVAMRSGGSLQVSGSVAALECDSAGGETLKVTFENAEVASVSGSGPGLLAGALGTLTTSGLLSAAGLAADDQGTHMLRIRRTGSACAALLGITDEVLATVTLDFAKPEPITCDHVGAFVGTALVSGFPIPNPYYVPNYPAFVTETTLTFNGGGISIPIVWSNGAPFSGSTFSGSKAIAGGTDTVSGRTEKANPGKGRCDGLIFRWERRQDDGRGGQYGTNIDLSAQPVY